MVYNRKIKFRIRVLILEGNNIMSNIKIAVLSDIHGNSLALEAVLNDIHNRGIEKILDLGDSLYGPLDPVGTAQLLLDSNIPSVRGNEDRIILESHQDNPTLEFVKEKIESNHKAWLESLSVSSIYHDFFLCHASPIQDDMYLIEEVTKNCVSIKDPFILMRELKSIKQNIILCGHSHVPHTIYLENGKYIINPGSVGLPAYFDDIPYPHKMETGSPHARYGIITQQEGQIKVQNISVPYKWEEAALLALKNGRTDWAGWLRTGRAFL
jgi:putative phosphoesterase